MGQRNRQPRYIEGNSVIARSARTRRVWGEGGRRHFVRLGRPTLTPVSALPRVMRATIAPLRGIAWPSRFTTQFFKFGFLWCIGRALELNAVAVSIGKGHHTTAPNESSARTRAKAVLFPKFVPVPNAFGSLIPGDAIAKLVHEQQHLAAVVGLMREHVGKHGASGGPCSQPATGKFRDPALWLIRQRIGEHAETLRRAFSVSSGSLLHRAAIWIEPSGAFQVRGGIPEPSKAAVVKVREDRGDGASAIVLGTGRLGAPSPRVEVREKELVHRVINRVGFQQDVSNLDQGFV